MTRDEILAAARDAGALVFQSSFCGSSFDFTLENLERFAALVAAPVRTKDLTDDEIDAIEIITDRQFARAVIEKFKEKNK